MPVLTDILLFSLVAIPVVFAALIGFMPAARAKDIALLGTVLAAVATAIAFVLFEWDNAAQVQLPASIDWLPALGDGARQSSVVRGVSLSVGVDSVALMLIGLTALL